MDRAFVLADDLAQLAPGRRGPDRRYFESLVMSRAAPPRRSPGRDASSSPSTPSPARSSRSTNARGDPAQEPSAHAFFSLLVYLFKSPKGTQVTQGKPWFIWCFCYLGAQGEPKGASARPKGRSHKGSLFPLSPYGAEPITFSRAVIVAAGRPRLIVIGATPPEPPRPPPALP
jgi:hypothetical protein